MAAPTTSLPEHIGGVRNWDYRFCWVRDAALTLYALLSAGYTAEARAWRQWLLRAVAGEASKIQVLYGVGVSYAVTPTIAARFEVQKPHDKLTRAALGVSYAF